MTRSLVAAVATVAVPVIAAPAVGGPSALEIAKRALRAAERPPAMQRLSVSGERLDERTVRFAAYCPRGMYPVSIDGSGFTSTGLSGRRAFAYAPYTRDDTIAVVTCLEARALPFAPYRPVSP
jgi:hypothetical protein